MLVSCIVQGLVNIGKRLREHDSAFLMVTTESNYNRTDFVNCIDAQILTAWKKTLGTRPLHKYTQPANFCVDTW